MKGPDNKFCIRNVEMEAERSLQLKYHPTPSFPRLMGPRRGGPLGLSNYNSAGPHQNPTSLLCT